jgi:pimeloyl-ACP methyl ester carboxylesterase
MNTRLCGVVVVAVLALLGLAASTASAEGRRSYSGAIDGAAFRVEVPEHWNGTLVLYSHGYYPKGFQLFGLALTNRPPDRSESEAWLLEHGYALAASQFPEDGLGYQVENALRDQVALLDWFEANVGRPRHTVATGQSLGSAIALLLAERHPDRFAGVATFCGAHDPYGTFNAELDVNFVVKILLAPGENIELVNADDPAHSADALVAAVDRALATPQGRARVALAGAMNNIVGWYSALQPRPVDMTEWIRQQAAWIQGAYISGRGPVARADIERRAGGNPFYRRQLARSSQRDLVKRAYREAGLSLRRDLARLERAPRIGPDPTAVRYMYRFGVPTGRISAPVVTLHSLGDGGAVPDHERWYAEQVRRSSGGDRLRQLYVDRGMHCSFSAADEIVALRTLFERIDSGRWPDTSPQRLNDAVSALGNGYQRVLDFATFQDQPMPPAFTRFLPAQPLRPAR